MANLTINPAESIKTELSVPGDKSISHRAIMLGALAQGETVVNGFLRGEDCLATIDCFRKLGIEIEEKEKQVIIKGKGLHGLRASQEVLNVGNSGTTIRLISGILAGQPFTTKITGDASIQKRPMLRICDPLAMMGASITTVIINGNKYAPFTIWGANLSGIKYEPSMASAQVKSAILLAGLYADGETSVIEKIKTRDHTERMMKFFGVNVSVKNMQTTITGQKEFKAKDVDVPGDISSAAYFMVAGLIVPNSEVIINNVGVNPTRTGIIDVLHRMGAKLEVFDEQFLCEEPRANLKLQTSNLKGIKISGELIPRIIDEIPIIAVAATQAEGVTEIRGARELRVKESDRLATTCSELRKMGANIKELDDGLIIEGPTKLKGAKIESCGDHRIAMSAAIAGLVADGQTVIEKTDCIETSFPGFAKLLTLPRA